MIYKNLAYGIVATAPSPDTSGTSLVLGSGEGANFPDTSADGPFYITVFPNNTDPTPANAEICLVTSRSTDTLTIVRTEKGTSARAITIGDRVIQGIYAEDVGVTSLTYAELVTLIGDSGLVAGGKYLITDFATTHFIVDGDGNQDTGSIITGDTEPLLVTATGSNTIDKEAKSALYPQDIIHYDWNPDNWADDLSFGDTSYNQEQIESLTLTGAAGTANITLAGGLTKLATFNTDLTTTASDFVTAFANDYLSKNIFLTSSGSDLIFTARVAGVPFIPPAISNVTGDLAGSVLNGNPNVAVMVTGFKGVIYFRHDTILDNYMGYDFRNVKFRRWETDVPAWAGTPTSYSKGDYVTYSGFIYKSLVNLNENNTPADGSSFWVQLLDLSLTPYWNASGSSWKGITSGAGFVDVKTFAEGIATATYERCCRSNHFIGFKDDNYDYEAIATILMNNVFFLQDNDYYQVYSNEFGAECNYNTIGNNFNYNTIGNNFNYNTIGNSFNYNTIGNSFNYNTIGNSFNYNTIGNNFYYNTIGNSFNYNTIGNYFNSNTIGNSFYSNTIGNYFNSNTIGNSFYYNTIGNSFNYNTIGNSFNYNTIGNNFYYNTIGNYFNSNTIGNYFNSNTIGNSFNYNTIGNYFNYNTIGNYFNYNTIGNYFYSNTIGNYFQQNDVKDNLNYGYVAIDFTSAIYVYTTYNKTLFLDSAGVQKLSYIDGSGVLTVVAANA